MHRSVFAALLAVAASSKSSGATKAPCLQLGVVYPFLHYLGLTFIDRHVDETAAQLMHAFARGGYCASAREGGAYVMAGWNGGDPLLKAGAVHACFPSIHIFEPNPKDFDRWPQDKRGNRFTSDELRRISYPGPRALGNQSGSINMSYLGTRAFAAPVVRADASVQEHVFIFSLDVHGAELGALQGIDGTIRKHGIDVMLVELIPDKPRAGPLAPNVAVLKFLTARGYYLFDFIGFRWCDRDADLHNRTRRHANGRITSLRKPCSESALASKAHKRTGPKAMTAEWYATRERGDALPLLQWFNWYRNEVGPAVTTDILAVHRSYFRAEQFRRLLSMVAPEQASRGEQPRLQADKAKTWLQALRQGPPGECATCTTNSRGECTR